MIKHTGDGNKANDQLEYVFTLQNSHNLYHKELYGGQWGEYVCWYLGLGLMYLAISLTTNPGGGTESGFR